MKTMTKEYCLGFIYNKQGTEVLLLRKNKPENQKGKLNAIGGKLEQFELPINAMVRECWEETGLEIELEKWKIKSTLTINVCFKDRIISHKMYCYSTFLECDSISKVINWDIIRDEPLLVHTINHDLCEDFIDCLDWLIPFCRDERVSMVDFSVNYMGE